MLRNITNSPAKHTSPKTRMASPTKQQAAPPSLPESSGGLDLEKVFEIDLLRHLDYSDIFGKLGRTNAFFAKNVQRELCASTCSSCCCYCCCY